MLRRAIRLFTRGPGVVATPGPEPTQPTQPVADWIDIEIAKVLHTPIVTARDPKDAIATAAARNLQLLRIRRLESMNTDPSLEDEFSDE